MSKIGMLSGNGPAVTFEQGLSLFFAGLPIGIVGIVSGNAQGKAAASRIQLITKKEERLGNAIIYAVMVETYAILAFIISFLMYNGISVG